MRIVVFAQNLLVDVDDTMRKNADIQKRVTQLLCYLTKEEYIC